MMNDTSHFSQEDMGILPFYIIMLILFVVFQGKTILEFYRDFKKEDTLENPLIGLMVSLNSELTSLTFICIHLFVLSIDGSGFFVLSVFSRLLRTISQATMIWLIMTISFGWTVTYRNMQETDIYILCAIFVIMVHLLLTALTYVDDAESHKFHDFGGLQGIILICVRVIIYGIVLYGISETMTNASQKQKQFLKSLRLSASVYL